MQLQKHGPSWDILFLKLCFVKMPQQFSQALNIKISTSKEYFYINCLFLFLNARALHQKKVKMATSAVTILLKLLQISFCVYLFVILW